MINDPAIFNGSVLASVARKLSGYPKWWLFEEQHHIDEQLQWLFQDPRYIEHWGEILEQLDEDEQEALAEWLRTNKK